MRKILLLLSVVISAITVSAQDFSNKGKDFWITSGWHYAMGTGSPPVMTLSLTSDVNTTYSIEAYGVAVISFGNLTAGQVTNVNIPSNYFTYIPGIGEGEGLFTGKAIHVTAAKPIVVYSFTTQALSSAATLCLPTNVLGKQYYASSYSQQSANPTGNNFITIIAVEDGTTVEIIPTQTTKAGWAPGSINTINLNKGEIYQVLGAMSGNVGSDLTGTSIRSVASGMGGCKRIAVFSGSGRVWIPNTCGNGADNLYQQLYPSATWGRKYLTVPSSGRLLNYYRIILPNPSPTSNVRLNGTVIPYTSFSNNFYEFSNSSPNLIESDSAICVAQYFTSANCQGNPNPYDPDMVILNPVEQNINDVTLISSDRLSHSTTPQHYIHVIIKNNGTAISSFRFDGATIPTANWLTHPQDPTFSYLYLNNISETYHSLKSDSGFNAIAYGYSQNETYAYSAGTNVKDLYQQIRVQTQYGIETTPSVCSNSPFRFKVSLPYCADSIRWDLSNLPGPPVPTIDTIRYTTCTPGAGGPDSTTSVNGVTLYWYSLPSLYSFGTPGVYPVTITTYSPNSSGCGSEQQIDFDLQVSDPPVADFTFTPGGCVAELFQFTETTPQTPKPTYKWWWDFGDGSPTSNLRNPTHTFTAPGTYNVRYASITTPGCLSDTVVHQVVVPDLPNATINGNTTVCINAAQPVITFTGSLGTAPYTFTYTINGGAPLTVNSTGNTATVSVPTNIAGPFVYNLVSIKNVGSTLCTRAITGQSVTVNITPDATVTLRAGDNNNQTVCINTPITNIRYDIGGSGNGGTVSGLPTGITGTYAAGVITISGSSTQSGVFTYTIHPTGPCAIPVPDITGTITVTQDGTLSLTSAAGTDAQELCRNATITNITYDFGGSATGASVAGLPTGVTWSVAGNRVTITGTPTIAGNFTYTVSTTGPCVKPNLTGNILVNDLPTANFTYTTPSCQTRIINFTDASIANSGIVNTWLWDFGDGSPTEAIQNPPHVYLAPGTYTVTLTVSTDKGCTSSPIASIPVTINYRPQAGFTIPEVCINDVSAVFIDTSKIASGSIDPAGYEWDFGDGSPKTFTKDGTHLYLSPGVYQVTHVVTSLIGCKDTIVQPITINGANPVADFSVSNPTTLCANDSVTITNLSTVNFGNVTKLEIYWDVTGTPTIFETDDNPVVNKTYTHLYPNFQTPLTKNISVRLLAYSGTLCVNQVTRVITLNAAPKVQFNNMPDACLLAVPFQITQASEVGGVPGTGTFSGPGISPTGIFTPLIAGIGTHTIKYTFTSTAAGCVDTISNTITVLDTAHAVFSYVSPICEGNAATFVEQSTAPASVTLSNTTWNFGDGSPLENHLPGTSFTHTFPSAGTFIVTMFNTSAYGCLSTPYIMPVTVSPAPVPGFTVDKTDYCLPNAVVKFLNSSSIPNAAPLTYSWDFGEPSSPNNTSTAVNPSHWYAGTGPYSVKLLVTSDVGCYHDTTIIINNIHPQPKADFTFSKPAICIGDNVTITDNSDGKDGTINQWFWDLGDGTTMNASTFTHTFTDTLTYNVKLYSVNNFNCNSDTLVKPFTVFAYPHVNAGPDRFILEGGTITLNPVIYAVNATYLWTPNLFLIDNSIANVKVDKPLTDMTYTLKVTNGGGCSLSDDVFVKLLKFPIIPNTFTPNNDGINDTWRIDYLNTYPDNRVQVFTRSGQLVFESRGYNTPWDGTLKGKTLPIDTYYYIIEPGNGREPMTGYVTILK